MDKELPDFDQFSVRHKGQTVRVDLVIPVNYGADPFFRATAIDSGETWDFEAWDEDDLERMAHQAKALHRD